jgi:hypothetical protein
MEDIVMHVWIQNQTDREVPVFDVDGGPIKLDPNERKIIPLRSKTCASIKFGMLNDYRERDIVTDSLHKGT